MVIHRWNNQIQEAIIKEWVEGCKKTKGQRKLQLLRRQIADKFGVNCNVVRGIIELGATEGIAQNPASYGKTYEPINYHQLVGDLKVRMGVVEKKLEYLLDGVAKVLEDGETMGIHLQHLRQMGKWMKGRKAIELETEINQEIPQRLTSRDNNIQEINETLPATSLNDDKEKEIERLRREIDGIRDQLEEKKPPIRNAGKKKTLTFQDLQMVNKD